MSGPISQLAIHIRSSSNTGSNELRPVRIPTSISTALMDKIQSAPDSREVFGKAEIEDLVDTLGSEQVKWGTVDEASFAVLTLVFLYTEDCMAREEGIFRLYMVLDSMKTGNAQEIPRRTSFKNSAGEKTLRVLTQFFLDTTRRHLLARRWTGLLIGELLETKENQRLFRRICAEGQNSYFLQIGRLLVDGRYRIPKHICGSLVSQLLDGTLPSARKQLLFAIMPRDAFELKPFEDGGKFPISTGAQWEDDFAEYLLEIECSREQAGLRIPMCFMAIAVKTGSTYIGKFGGIVCDISDILTLRIPTDADLAHHSWIDIDLANIQAEADYLFVLDMKPMKTPETLVIQVRSDEAEFIKNDLISAKAYRREKWNKQQGISKLARPWLEMQGEDTSPKRSISVEPVKQWERNSQRRREQSQMEIADSQALTQDSIFTLQEVDAMMQEAQKPEDQQEPATPDDTDVYFQPVQVQQFDRQPSIVPETQDENEAVSEMQTKFVDSKNPSLLEASVPNNITQPALKGPTKEKESADLVPEKYNRKAVKSKGIPEALPVESPVTKAPVIENSSGTKNKPETNKPKDIPKDLPGAAPIITKQAASPAKNGAIALQKPADKTPTTKPAIKTYSSPKKWAGRLQDSETEKDIYDLTSDDDEPEPSKPTKKKPSAKGQNVKKPQAKASAKAPKKSKADIYDFDSGDESEPPKITGKRKGPAKGKQKASPAKRAKATPKTSTAKKGQKKTLAGSTDNIFGSDDENEQQARIQTPQSKEEMANKSKSTKEILTLPFKLPRKDAIKLDVSTKPSVPKNPTGKFAKAEPNLNTRPAVSNTKLGTKSKEKTLVSMKHSFLDNEDTSKKLATKKKSVDKVERPKRSTRAQVKNYKIESSDVEDDEEESESKDTEYNNSWAPSSTSEDPPTSTPLPKVPELPEEATAINFLTSSPAKKIAKSRKKPVNRNFHEEPISTHARQECQRPEEVASSSATKEVTKRPTAKVEAATSDVQEESTSTPQRMESLRLKKATSLSPTEEVNKGSLEKANPRTKPLKSNISPPRTTTITRKISSDRSEPQSAKRALMVDEEAPQELPKSGEDQINKKQSKLPRKLTPKDLEEIHSSPIWDETSDLSSIPDDDNTDDDEGSLIQINSGFDEPLTEGLVVEPDITDPRFQPEPMANHISVPKNTSLKKTPLTSNSKFDGEGKGKSSLKVFEPTIDESEVNAVVGARAVGNIPFTVPDEIPEGLRASNTSPKRIDELKKESDTKIGTTDTMGDKRPGQATKKISVQEATITTASITTMALNSDAKSNNQVHKSSSDEQIPTKEFRNKATTPEMPAPTNHIPPQKEDKFEAMYVRLKEAPVSPAAAKILQTRRKAVEDSKSEAKVLTKNDRPKNLVPGVIDGKSCSRGGKMSSPKSVTLKTSASKELRNSPFKEGIFDEMYKRIKQDPTSPAKAPWLKTESNRTPIGQPKFKSPVRSSAVKETPKTPHAEHTSVVFEATITSKETTSEKSKYDKVLGNSSKADSGFAASSPGKKVETPRTAENNYIQSRQNREIEQNDGPSDGYGASQADDAANSSEDDLYSVPKNISVMKKKLETLRSAQTKAARRIIVVAGEEEDFIRSMTQRTTAKQDHPVTKSSGSDKKPIQRQKTDVYFPQRRMTVEAATGSPLPKLLSSQRAMESANSLRLSSTSISPPYSPPIENDSVKIRQERTFPSSPPIVNRKLQPKQSDIDNASNEPIFIDSDSSEDPEFADGTPQVNPNPMDCQPRLPKVEKVEVSIDNKPLEEILSALSAGLNSPSSTKRPRFNNSSDKKVIKSVKSKVEPVFSGNKGPVKLGSPLVFTKGSELKRMGSREDVLPIVARKSSGPPDSGNPPDYRKPTGHVSKAPEGSGSLRAYPSNVLIQDAEDVVSSEIGRFYKSVQEHGLFRIKRERDSDDKEEKENRKPAKKRRSNDYDDSDSNSSTDDSDTESVSNVFINENPWRAALPDYHQETLAVLDRISHRWIQYLMSGEEKAGQIMKDYEAQADEVIRFLQKSHRDEYNEFLTRVKAMREKMLQLCNNAREEARMMVPKGLDLGATKRNLKRKHEELEGGIEDMISTLMGSL
ncbi:hypothetical protein BZA77DRAFT_376720 [Pyronema omphalodes]|nr:hypothetical protein BZA77DRAFT_376720 [Pyronema omphalodes]